MSEITNIAAQLSVWAEKSPDRDAVVEAVRGSMREYRSLTFRELDSRAARYAAGLHRVGIRKGVKTVLMVTPGLDFFALVFALFRVGATLILIDPGIDKRALKKCLAEVEPEAFVGVSLAHVARLVFRDALSSVKINVTVGRRWFWGGHRLRDLLDDVGRDCEPTEASDLAAVLFTSGSTGVPKGAEYTQGIFSSQVRMLQEIYAFGEDEVDLSTFPLFALFLAALGVTSVIPDMDARHPARANPRKLLAAIEDHGCTNMFGSPALLDVFSAYGERRELKLPTLRRVLSAGAPVRPEILRRMHRMLAPGVQVFTPYGATESLPVANVGSGTILGGTEDLTATGHGVCVGHPVDGMTVRVIAIGDEPIATWSDDLLVPTGVVGEITVRGPVVTAAYHRRPAQTALAKIDDAGRAVHRMGDLGAFDAEGRLWMCGRKTHRVRTADGDVFTIPVEMVFNQDPDVWRTALVGLGERGAQEPVLLVEPHGTSNTPWLTLHARLRAAAASTPVTDCVRRIVLYPGTFPVDIRHNAKINRETLTVWANEHL
ncbi:MAG: AMP-binding protein [Deltaproteobacteria bacterium]|nr:AMP-binding protein [Deltaproteobacteria bacterium]